MSVGASKLGAMAPLRPTEMGPLCGLKSTAQLLGEGRAPHQLRALVLSGQLVELSRGVYGRPEQIERFRSTPSGQESLRAAAALVTAAPGAVASRQTAAAIHGLQLVSRPPGRVSITRPRFSGSRSGKAGVLV